MTFAAYSASVSSFAFTFTTPTVTSNTAKGATTLGISYSGTNTNVIPKGFSFTIAGDSQPVDDSAPPALERAKVERVERVALRLRHLLPFGIAHDGDADRVLLCDEKGQIIDGDDIMAVAALDMLEQNALARKTLVATIMSNAGMDAAIKHCSAGIGLWEWASNDEGSAPDVVMACAGDVPTICGASSCRRARSTPSH